MGAITIKDLPINYALDREAMLSIKGGGAGWIYGAFQPYIEAPSASFGSVSNFYQVTNNFYAEKMINKSQAVTINNSGDNCNINAVLISSLAA